MPTLVVLGNVKIQIFAGDHNPPHFHVVTPDGEAAVLLPSLKVFRGGVRPRHLAVALAWARRNQELLTNEWHRLNS
jgi:hypothetical protein